MGARLILNSRYFHIAKAGEIADGKHVLTKDRAAALVNYVGTRETVQLNVSKEALEVPATYKQKELIDNLIQEFPDCMESLEYADYIEHMTMGNANEFITQIGEITLSEGGAKSNEEISNLVDYVANRPGVVKVGSHGLFGDEENIDLNKRMEEISTHDGNIWTHVVSLRREDADRLGYDSQQPWKDLLNKHIDDIAKQNHISLSNLKWCAGVHNTGHHPHIHLFLYSDNPKEGCINTNGIEKVKSTLANDIFADELKEIYTQKTEYRNELKQEVNNLLNKPTVLPNDIQQKLAQELQSIATSLPQKGKMQYKYMPTDVKNKVDSLLDNIVNSSDELTELYSKWCKEQIKVFEMYNNNPSDNFPIADNSTFYSLKNAIIKEAKKINSNTLNNPLEYEPYFDPNQNQDQDSITQANSIENTKENTMLEPPDNYRLAQKYEKGIDVEKDYEQAAIYYTKAAQEEIPEAQYRLAKYLENGTVQSIGIDKETAQILYEKSLENYIEQDNAAPSSDTEYKIANMYLQGKGTDINIDEAISWLNKSAEKGSLLAQNKKELIHKQQKENKQQLKNENISEPTNNVKWDEEFEQLKDTAMRTHDPKACYQLAKKYLYGTSSVTQDIDAARMWFGISADRGYALAQYRLGTMYLYGAGGDEPNIELGNEYCLKSYINFKMELLDMQWSKYYDDDKVNGYAGYLQHLCGKMNYKGEGMEKNYEKALVWFTKSALNENAHSHFYLGNMAYSGEGQKQDYLTAARHYQYADELGGDAYACYKLAQMFKNGVGIETDYEQAALYYSKAAEEEIPYAQYELAKFLENGTVQSIGVDEKSAHILYEKALKNFVKQNNASPDTITEYKIARMYLLGKGTEINIDEAISWLSKSAEKENASAQYDIAKIYSEGKYVDKDTEKAEQLYKQALKNFIKQDDTLPNVQTQYKIGCMYNNGLGTELNEKEAIIWLTKAADNGHTQAQSALGKIYFANNDISQAIKYYTMAAQGNDQYSQYRLGILYLQDEFKDIPKSLNWLELSAIQGNPFAQYKLGSLYSGKCDNLSHLENTETSQMWYSKALNNFVTEDKETPSPDTEYKIAQMYENGLGTAVDMDKAIEYYTLSAEKENTYAQYRLGTLYSGRCDTMSHLKDTAAAQFWYAKALANLQKEYESSPSADTAYRIGTMYHFGNGTEKDIGAAKLWYAEAVELGSVEAQQQLQKINEAAILGVLSLVNQISRCISSNINDTAKIKYAHTDKKLRKKQRQKQLAMGHKHEQQQDY